MRKITATRIGGSPGKQIGLSPDGQSTFRPETAAVERPRVDRAFWESQVGAGAGDLRRCLAAAIRYLSYRPRSEAELRERLGRRGFDGDSVEAAIARLKDLGLVNDAAFARYWKNNRESFSPRSRGATRLELRQKGVPGDIIDGVVSAIDDDDSAYQAAVSRARSLPWSDYESFRRRLGGHLRRRGFGYGVIDRALKRVWEEHKGDSDE